MSDAISAFRGTGYSGEGPLDLKYFDDLPNESVAQAALDLISNPAFIGQAGRFHTEHEINAMKRSVYRACVATGVQLPSRCVIDARLLGVQLL